MNLYKYDKNSHKERRFFNGDRINKNGEYKIYLRKEKDTLSNIVNIDIANFNDEKNLLPGQNIRFLNKIKTESDGKYFDQRNYLQEIEDLKKTNNNIIKTKKKIDFKEYLILLFVSLLLLSLEWFLRRKRGLL